MILLVVAGLGAAGLVRIHLLPIRPSSPVDLFFDATRNAGGGGGTAGIGTGGFRETGGAAWAFAENDLEC